VNDRSPRRGSGPRKGGKPPARTGGKQSTGQRTGGTQASKSAAYPRKATAKSFGTAKSGTRKGGKFGDQVRKGAKRTSRNTDERNPTRSGVDYPSPKFRRKGGEAEAPEPARPALRKTKTSRDATPKRAPRRTKARAGAPAHRRRRIKTTEASEELARLAGRNARKAQEQLARAAEAFAEGRERDALRLVRPLRDAYPDASAVRELMGLCHYRLGQYAAAAKELEAFVELTDSVEQHPVLMDSARALGKPRRVEELWDELAAASPAGAIVSEGRIVLAGSRADRGRLREAIATLDRKIAEPKRVQEHHLRLWYALADLLERAGEVPRARDLFLRVRRHDASFADVAERLAALG
jgi:tetratricopeptide (TPR) repeat protein